jgi:hypothetical protein
MAKSNTDPRIGRIERTLKELLDTIADTATKDDIAGVAKNVDIAALGVQLRAIRDDLAAVKMDLRVLAATVDRIDTVIIQLMAEGASEHSRVRQLADRLDRLAEQLQQAMPGAEPRP